MSQQLVGILVSAGGILLAAAILGAVRGAFKVAKAIRANTDAVTGLSKDLAEYMHGNDTEKAVMRKDIQDLKDWRLQTETTNRHAALGSGAGGAAG